MRPGREEVFPPKKYLEREQLEQIREAKATPKEAAKVTEVAPGESAASGGAAAPGADGPPES